MPPVQDSNSGLAALATFLYRRQPTLCTFLDQGRQAPGTQGYQPLVQDGNSGLAALGTFLYRRQPAFSGPISGGQQDEGLGVVHHVQGEHHQTYWLHQYHNAST